MTINNNKNNTLSRNLKINIFDQTFGYIYITANLTIETQLLKKKNGYL